MLRIVHGGQDGDEGKGRVCDNFSQERSVTGGIRSEGGNNAGHTMVISGETYKLSLVPAAVLSGKLGFLGRGMVIDLDRLQEEISFLKKIFCLDSLPLFVDSSAHVIFPWHKIQDGLDSELQGVYAAGSTKRGIAPAYAAKMARWGVRLDDLLHDPGRVTQVRDYYLRLLEGGYGQKRDGLVAAFDSYFVDLPAKLDFVAPYVVPSVSPLILERLERREALVGECAQADHIGVDSPYYPYTTSSGTSAPGFMGGLGLGPCNVEWVIAVVKAYMTRVGGGPFLTEMEDQGLAGALRNKGNERGTVTGRDRRIGWLDLPLLRYAVANSGSTGLAITKLDVLGGLEKLFVAHAYSFGEEKIPTLWERGPVDLRKCRPSYSQYAGWEDFSASEYREKLDVGRIDFISDLALRKYLQGIQRNVGVPIRMVTFGADRVHCVRYN